MTIRGCLYWRPRPVVVFRVSPSSHLREERMNMQRSHAVFTILFSLVVIACGQQRALAAGATVTVDYSQPKQTIAGFGASITWLAGDLNNFAPADQTAVLDALYSTTKPSAGLSIIRAGSMLCEFNPSAGTYNWNHPLIQSEISWMNRVKSTY